jgi:hypothetical protein
VLEETTPALRLAPKKRPSFVVRALTWKHLNHILLPSVVGFINQPNEKNKNTMKKLFLCLSAAALLSLTGCVSASSPNVGTWGFVYTDVSGGVSATSNANSTKVGIAVSKAVICVAWGDSSIKTACANGGITKIHHVDYHNTSVLGVYSEVTVTVYGE